MGHLSNPVGLRLFLNRYSSFLWSSSKLYFLLTQQDFLIFQFLVYFFNLSLFKKLNCIFYNFKIIRFFNYFYLNIFVYNFHLFSFLGKFLYKLPYLKIFSNYFNFYKINLNSIVSFYFVFFFRFISLEKLFFNISTIKQKTKYFSLFLKFSNYQNIKLFCFNYFSLIKFVNFKRFNNNINLRKLNKKVASVFRIVIQSKKKIFFKMKKLKKDFFRIFKFLFFNKIKIFFEKTFWMYLKDILIFNISKILNISNNCILNFFFLNPKYLDTKFLIQFLIYRLRQGISFHSLFFKISKILSSFLSRNRLLGFKISLKGRFSRKQRASFSWKRVGRVPLNSKLCFVDFASGFIILKYGMCSLKLWLNFSKLFLKRKFFFIL